MQDIRREDARELGGNSDVVYSELLKVEHSTPRFWFVVVVGIDGYILAVSQRDDEGDAMSEDVSVVRGRGVLEPGIVLGADDVVETNCLVPVEIDGGVITSTGGRGNAM